MTTHHMTYRTVEVHEGYFDASFVLPDGTLAPESHADTVMVERQSEAYECSCGDRFLKPETAAEHLRKHAGGDGE